MSILRMFVVVIIATRFASTATSEPSTCFDYDADSTVQFESMRAEKISREHAPWMVFIRSDQQVCGGTLLTKEFVLTAAHCLHPQMAADPIWTPISKISVSRVTESGGHDGESRAVISAIAHENYDRASIANDVAILHLETPYDEVELGDLPLMLTEETESSWIEPGTCARTMGWGATRTEWAVSESLLQIKVPIWPQDLCKKSMGADVGPYSICAGYVAGQFDSCSGDSGGPLLVEGGPRKHLIVGIVSWGSHHGCAAKGKSGVYTRASFVQKEVYSMIRELRANSE